MIASYSSMPLGWRRPSQQRVGPGRKRASALHKEGFHAAGSRGCRRRSRCRPSTCSRARSAPGSAPSQSARCATLTPSGQECRPSHRASSRRLAGRRRAKSAAARHHSSARRSDPCSGSSKELLTNRDGCCLAPTRRLCGLPRPPAQPQRRNESRRLRRSRAAPPLRRATRHGAHGPQRGIGTRHLRDSRARSRSRHARSPAERTRSPRTAVARACGRSVLEKTRRASPASSRCVAPSRPDARREGGLAPPHVQRAHPPREGRLQAFRAFRRRILLREPGAYSSGASPFRTCANAQALSVAATGSTGGWAREGTVARRRGRNRLATKEATTKPRSRRSTYWTAVR